MARQKKFLQAEQTQVDKETGEIVTQIKRYAVKVSTEDFYMTFFTSLAGFFELKSAIDIKVMVKMCEYAQFNTGQVDLSPASRQELCDYLKISKQQLTNALRSLKAKSLLAGDKGRFMVNPSVFWKGSTDARARLLEDQSLEISFKFHRQ